ncbi:hypothetical protein C807_00788, partial [Lachnospiraceae bacterium 28-4]
DEASHAEAVRPPVEDGVGGRGVEAQQCVQRTRTNRPRAYPSWRSGWWKKGYL